jgi:predicted nucleotidyltransferase
MISIFVLVIESILLSFWGGAEADLKNRLSKAFRHWNYLKVVNDGFLDKLGITRPKLSGLLSDNLALIEEDIRTIHLTALTSKLVPELAQLIYPVVLVYGSCLKGYGESDADIDLGVFFRPGASVSDGEKFRDLLRENFCHGRVGDEITEFWLEEDGDFLRIRDFEERKPYFGSSQWTHVLFGAAWEGEEASICELRERLLTPYLFEAGEIRGAYLEEMERDTLLYRLLHKGYERFFPSCGGVNSASADRIDGQSLFYDSGYRQLATKLFVDRVFLPVIS